MKLIDKDKVVAELEKLYNLEYDNTSNLSCGKKIMLRNILLFLDTLEVKDVNLDESARHYLLYEHISPLNEVLHHADLKVEIQYHKDIEDAYKAGFKLGLKAKKGE